MSDDTIPEGENANVFALPGYICGKPIYESNDGFRILKAVVNDDSLSFREIEERIPTPWKKPQDFARGDFVLTVNSDYPLTHDVPYIFIGEVTQHKKYGAQFKAYSYCSDDPSDERMMIAYLSRLPNVKEKRARMILEEFGLPQIANIMENDHRRLTAINGITEKRADEIRKEWMKDRIVRRVFMWLLAHNISAIFGRRIIDAFGSRSIEILEANPYQLTDIHGISFLKADEIAHKMLALVPKDLRTKSCVNFLLRENEHSGHTCYPMVLLQREACKLLAERSGGEYGKVVNDVILSDFVVVGDKETKIPFVYLPSMFRNEYRCAEFLANLTTVNSLYSCTDEDLDEAENKCALEYPSVRNFHFDDNQNAAIKSAFSNKLTVITGGGGTGKSTICNAICKIAFKRRWGVTLFAPTGQAAKILGEKTKMGASTIHRGLGLVPGGKGKNSNVATNPGCENGVVQSEILIIDEFSMVGTDLLPYVFDAIVDPSKTNIVLVGDPQQLPSISPGNNLYDIIASGAANVVKLSQIYRQSENSHISWMADKIAHGTYVAPPARSDDFFWTECNDNEEVLSHVEKLASECDDVRDLQVLASIYKRSCGVELVNELFQRLFTSSSGKSISHERRTYYLGDRVMHIVNNYDKQVFNGNIGYIIDLGMKNLRPDSTDKESMFIVVKMEGASDNGREVVYENDDISELRVAWCSTVHKFQGGQMPQVIFLMPNDHRVMMSRELVYTAFTRAQKSLHVIGTKAMLTRASSKSIIETRYTNLVKLFKKFIDGDDKLVFRFPENFELEVKDEEDEDDDDPESLDPVDSRLRLPAKHDSKLVDDDLFT